jgi:hypothetical protein
MHWLVLFLGINGLFLKFVILDNLARQNGTILYVQMSVYNAVIVMFISYTQVCTSHELLQKYLP